MWNASELLFDITHPGIIEPKSIEGQLEVKILVDLRYGVVDVLLIITIAIITTLIEEAIHEIAADLPETSLGDDVGLFFWAESMGRRTKPVIFTV